MERAALVVMLTACGFDPGAGNDASIDASSTIADAPIDAGDAGGPFWVSVVGANAVDNNVVSTVPSGWGSSGAVTRDMIGIGSGYVEFSTAEPNLSKSMGLGNGNTNASFTDIEFAMVLSINKRLFIYEAGTLRGQFGTYAAGDLFRVEISGGVVRYLRNGVLLYTSASAPTYPLVADAALFHTGATITNVVVVDLP